MVYLPPASSADCLTAYLTTTLTNDELNAFKSAFELGACSQFSPLLELKIVQAPDDYMGKPHQYVRSKENEAGRKGPFTIIDEEAKRRGAIWYIDHFADEYQVEDGEVESTEVVLKILIKTEALALSYINYNIANMSVEEDLENCDVEMPLTNDFYQPKLNDCGCMDLHEQQWHQDAWVTAEPGELEESTDDELRENFLPRPEKVARLKEDVAQAVGLVSSWTIPKTFPDGSVVLRQRYDPEHPWPEHNWPDGSL